MRRNEMKVSFEARSINESFARTTVAAFVMSENPTMDEISDIKTAVSEAVTNAIIHGYDVRDGDRETEACPDTVELSCRVEDGVVEIAVTDRGKGIPDVEKAREPFFTTGPEPERSGMGFAFMEAFMDEVEVFSKPGLGTRVVMRKRIGV